MYSFLEITLVIIAIILLIFYIKTTIVTTDCDLEKDEHFGNFTTNNQIQSPVVTYINKKYNDEKDLEIKKLLFIPTIFNNNSFYKDSDLNKIYGMNSKQLGDYVKNTNMMYFVDLLNAFTQDRCQQNEYKILLNMFINNYITFNNSELSKIFGEENVNDILENFYNLYLEVRSTYNSYLNILMTKINNINDLTSRFNQINLTLIDVVQQYPRITNVISRLKNISFNTQTQFTDNIDKATLNSYSNNVCSTQDNINLIKDSESMFISQIKKINSTRKYNSSNINIWIPTYVTLSLTKADISNINNESNINDAFNKYIFPKIFNYSLIFILNLTNIKNKIKNDTILNAIDVYIKYITTYLTNYIYINIYTNNVNQIELQKLEPVMDKLQTLIFQASN